MSDIKDKKDVFQNDSVLKAILSMAIPTIISQMITVIYNYADTIFIGQLNDTLQSAAIALAMGDAFDYVVLSIGLPSVLIPFLSAISNGVLNNLVSSHGDTAVAAVGIAKKMDLLPANVALGITQGTLPLLAYSFGAGEHKKLRKLLYITGVLAFSTTAIVVILLEIFATPVATLFIRDADTIRYATQFIRRLCLSVPLYAITLMVNSFFQAVNKPKHSFVISVMRKGIFDLSLMVLFNTLFGVISIIWVQPIMDLVTTLISLFVLKHFINNNRKAVR